MFPKELTKFSKPSILCYDNSPQEYDATEYAFLEKLSVNGYTWMESEAHPATDPELHPLTS